MSGQTKGATSILGNPRAAQLVSISLIVIVVVRFFTEVIKVLPTAMQWIDMPIVGIVALYAVGTLSRRRLKLSGGTHAMVMYVFAALCAVSATLNASRVSPFPALLFVYGLLAPIIFAVAIMNMDMSVEDLRKIVRVFVWLGIAELGIGFLYDVPVFISTKNPDVVSGTFGLNAYYFAYFIGLWLLYVLGASLIGPHCGKRVRSLYVAVSVVGVFVLFFLAQYRSMIVFFVLVILGSMLVSPLRSWGQIGLTMLIVVSSFGALVGVNAYAPNLKLLKTFELVTNPDPTLVVGKVISARNVMTMHEDIPHTFIVGSGPGTESSRAYITFANRDYKGKTPTLMAITDRLTGGSAYSTDVARKYLETVPDVAIQGGQSLASPFSSYISLAAETGVVGTMLYLALYAMAIAYSYGSLKRHAKALDGDGFALAFACVGGLLLMLCQALFENWFEALKITVPLWTLIGVLAAYDARLRLSVANSNDRPTSTDAD